MNDSIENFSSPNAKKRRKMRNTYKKISPGVSHISGYLYIGSGRDAHNRDLLASLGISHIINCAAAEWPSSTDLPHLDLPLHDVEDQSLAHYFEPAFSFLTSLFDFPGSPYPRGEPLKQLPASRQLENLDAFASLDIGADTYASSCSSTTDLKSHDYLSPSHVIFESSSASKSIRSENQSTLNDKSTSLVNLSQFQSLQIAQPDLLDSAPQSESFNLSSPESPCFSQPDSFNLLNSDSPTSFQISCDSLPSTPQNLQKPDLQFSVKNGQSPEVRVLVHCVMGKSRSVSTCLAWLIYYHRMTLKEAFDLIATRRPVAPNDGFMRQLMQFEAEIFSLSSVEESSMFNIWQFGHSTQPRSLATKKPPSTPPPATPEELEKASIWVEKVLFDQRASIDWQCPQMQRIYASVSRILTQSFQLEEPSQLGFTIRTVRVVFPPIMNTLRSQLNLSS